MPGGGVAGSDGRSVGGSKLSYHWEQNYASRQCCWQESSRGVEKNGGEGVVFKKKSFEASQSSNQDAELDVAKCPRGGQER